MARCPVELAQNGIMLSLAEKGEAAIPGLAYNYSADEKVAAAAKSMVYNSSFGGILRSNVISVIGAAGSFEDGIQILLPLLNFSRVENRPTYISSINLGTSEIEYTPEQNMAIRLAVLQALENIIRRKENENISCPVAGGFGKIVASAALVDPNPRVRSTAARMLAKYGSPEILSFSWKQHSLTPRRRSSPKHDGCNERRPSTGNCSERPTKLCRYQRSAPLEGSRKGTLEFICRSRASG